MNRFKKWFHDHDWQWDEQEQDGFWMGHCRCGEERREALWTSPRQPWANPNPRYSPLRKGR